MKVIIKMNKIKQANDIFFSSSNHVWSMETGPSTRIATQLKPAGDIDYWYNDRRRLVGM